MNQVNLGYLGQLRCLPLTTLIVASCWRQVFLDWLWISPNLLAAQAHFRDSFFNIKALVCCLQFRINQDKSITSLGKGTWKKSDNMDIARTCLHFISRISSDMQPTFQSRKTSRSGTAGMKITKLDLDHLDGGFKYLLCSPRTLGK